MTDFRRVAAAVVLSIGLTLAATASGSAAVGPETGAGKSTASASASANVPGSFQVAGKRSRRNVRTGAAIVGGLILGGILLNEVAKAEQRKQNRAPEYSEDPWDRCARKFRSFDPEDGTFQPHGGGPREVCPYL